MRLFYRTSILAALAGVLLAPLTPHPLGSGAGATGAAAAAVGVGSGSRGLATSVQTLDLLLLPRREGEKNPQPQAQAPPDLLLQRRADPSLTGYLGVFFLGSDPYVYFYLSNGNNPVSFRALNRGSPVIRPTKGTRGVRDPTIVAGGGAEAGRKWYIIGTDLNIGSTSWNAAQRTGSRGIFVWESTDLINWTAERLVVVEDETAGMVWAPEAIWDPSQNQYMVYWSSKFYPTSDRQHTGSPSNTQIRYAYTPDFKTFSAPKTYVNLSPSDTIDLTILPVPGSTSSGDAFIRFMKDETRKTVFSDYGTSGLHGTFVRQGGSSAIIASGVEGPAAYWDNVIEGRIHLLMDFYGADGYRPYENSAPVSAAGGGAWKESDRRDFPKNLRHGSVLPVNQTLYDALRARWG